MSQTYFALLTEIGEAKLARAATLGAPLALTSMGVGDGNGITPIPNSQQTGLINEVRRAPLNQLSIDPKNPNHIIAEQVIPENEGGWWIREIGLYDEAGELCAVANAPPTYKPVLAEGSGRVQVIRMTLLINSQNAEHIELKIDPSIVLATREYVATAMAEHMSQDNPHPQYMHALDFDTHLKENNPHAQYAPIDSPFFTGKPKVPTPESGDRSTQVANTEFISQEINRRSPMINLLSDSGRFYDATANPSQRANMLLGSTFSNPNFTVYTTSVVSAGKFLHDNANYGGTQATLQQSVIDLLKATKRHQLRYGQEFYIAEFSAGAVNTHHLVIDGRSTYLALSSGIAVTGLLTFTAWIRCIKGAVALDVTTHKNGLEAASPLVLPHEGWIHCAGTVNWTAGYSIIHFWCEPDSVFQVTLPAFLLGDFTGSTHSAPLLSLYS